MHKKTSMRRAQSGAALLIVMLVVIVGAAAIFVTKLNRGAARAALNSDTHAALARAKAALLEFAVTYQDMNPGASAQLPCPDIDAGGTTIDGESHTANCGAVGVTMLGRVPWRTLGMSAPTDATGECLWYAVSGEHKSASAATTQMINSDTNGLIQVFSLEDGSILAGATPDDRPAAILLAPLSPVDNQTRGSISQQEQQCSDDFVSADFLETDSVTGISNATVAANADTISRFIVSAANSSTVNDRVLTISNADLAEAFHERHDFQQEIDSLTRAIAQCVSAYGQSNPGGGSDRRLPWPAPLSTSDYRDDDQYDDADSGVLSGRLADIVDESNVSTGNPIFRILTDCDPALAPDWSAQQLALWRNWKDHFFFVVAEAFQPTATVPNSCGNCLTVNGTGQYSALVFFAGPRLESLAQARTVPPLDADTKSQIANYLEGLNASNHPYTGGAADFETQPAGTLFNDTAYCIDSTLAVAGC